MTKTKAWHGLPSTCAEALQCGVRHFLPFERCDNGHLSVYRVRTKDGSTYGYCVECNREQQAAYRQRNKPALNVYQNEYRQKNLQLVRAKERLRYHKKRVEQELDVIQELITDPSV